jgi:hypothetical protein
VAYMVHFGEYRVSELKAFLGEQGVKVRARW